MSFEISNQMALIKETTIKQQILNILLYQYHLFEFF